MAAASRWLSPSTFGFPTVAAAAAELGPAGSACCHLSVTHSMPCWRDPERSTQALLHPSSCVLSLAISPRSLLPFTLSRHLSLSFSPSKAVAGSGRQCKLPLNNCAEAESAGSNPLSRVQLIITTVCLRAGPDNDDRAGFVHLSAWQEASDRLQHWQRRWTTREVRFIHVTGDICEDSEKKTTLKWSSSRQD